MELGLGGSLGVGSAEPFGTRPYRPFWIALAVIALFALIYAVSRPFARSDPEKGAVSIAPRPLFALMFSVDKFLPVNATGIEEWGWDIAPDRRWIRWLANVESLLGFVITALAAFSVGSYLL